jgi:hypothetical protein
MVHRLFPADELDRMIQAGELFDSHTLAAYALLKVLGV